MALKRCGACGRDLPRERFYQALDKRRGKKYPSWRCIECEKAGDRERRRRQGRPSREELKARSATGKAERERDKSRRRSERLAQKAGRQYRPREQRVADSAARRVNQTTSPVLACSKCGETRPRDDFHPSALDTCKACVSKRDRATFLRAKETLSDTYVKRQLTKHTGLRRGDIPAALIEAKRIQLAIHRMVAARDSVPIAERLRRRTEVRGECWIWTGAFRRAHRPGRGRKRDCGWITVDGRMRMVHRVAFEVAKGPIPRRGEVWRSCGEHLCINPAHLELREVHHQEENE